MSQKIAINFLTRKFCRLLTSFNHIWHTNFTKLFITVVNNSAFSVVAANSQQSDKAEHGCTTTNLPLPNAIKTVSVLQRLHGEIWRTISDVQKRDEQTD